jgi:hypothetical protein
MFHIYKLNGKWDAQLTLVDMVWYNQGQLLRSVKQEWKRGYSRFV